jgi:hypothetical protein
MFIFVFVRIYSTWNDIRLYSRCGLAAAPQRRCYTWYVHRSDAGLCTADVLRTCVVVDRRRNNKILPRRYFSDYLSLSLRFLIVSFRIRTRGICAPISAVHLSVSRDAFLRGKRHVRYAANTDRWRRVEDKHVNLSTVPGARHIGSSHRGCMLNVLTTAASRICNGHIQDARRNVTELNAYSS